MKILTVSTLYTAVVSGAAILEPRQGGGGGYCFVFARGSTEPAPLVGEFRTPQEGLKSNPSFRECL
jgi:hypothetical protein